MSKPIIFCIIGESGSGKTMIAEALEKYADIPMIQSYTDRPRRTPDENGHTFLTKEQFDELRREDMIAYTNWNGFRYCCLSKDVKPVNTYVIDESGLDMLKKKWSGMYDVFSFRIYRDKALRVESVGEDRVMRDNGKFNLKEGDFDCCISNHGLDTKLDVILYVWEEISGYLRECQNGIDHD